MNPKNHRAFSNLFNLGIPKRLQQDVSEYNRIRVQPDAASAVMFTCEHDGTEFIIDMPGRDAPPQRVDYKFIMSFSAYEEGTNVCVSRKRLIEILQGMTSEEVWIDIKERNGPMLVSGSYDKEPVSVYALIMPHIEVE